MPLLYGLQPFAYFPQHVLMHHAESNQAADLTSTLRYRRDSRTDFLRYWLRFMTLDNLGLALYLWRHGRHAALARYLAGTAAFFTLAAGLAWWSPAATCIVFVLPYVLTRFFLMAGNWAQHAFIHPATRDPRLQQATLLVNASHNRRCFNDGYHALHHRWPGLHWADMAARYRTDWRYYADHEVLVFDGVPNNQVIWWRLMKGDYDYLARHLAPFDWLPRDHAARVELLKQRVQTRYCAHS
jgi:fatty acid desaturase